MSHRWFRSRFVDVYFWSCRWSGMSHRWFRSRFVDVYSWSCRWSGMSDLWIPTNVEVFSFLAVSGRFLQAHSHASIPDHTKKVEWFIASLFQQHLWQYWWILRYFVMHHFRLRLSDTSRIRSPNVQRKMKSQLGIIACTPRTFALISLSFKR